MNNVGRTLIWFLPSILVWGGCAVPTLRDSPVNLGAWAKLTRPAAESTPVASVPAEPEDREAALVRETALKMGYSQVDAAAYEELVRTAEPHARPFLTRLVYAQLYRGSEDHASDVQPVADASSRATRRVGLRESAGLANPSEPGRSTADQVADAPPSPPQQAGDSAPGNPSTTSDSAEASGSTLAAGSTGATTGHDELVQTVAAQGVSRPTADRPITVPHEPFSDADADADALSSDSRLGWRKELRRTILRMREELDGSAAETGDLDPDEQARLRAALSLMYLVVDELEQAMESLDGLDDQQLDFWRQTVMALGVLLDGDELPKFRHRVDTATAHLYDGIRSLSTLGPLRLMNPTFCTKVNGFGDYVECDAYALKPGAPVLLYVEVENFTVEEVDLGAVDRRGGISSRRTQSSASRLPMYETELHGRYEILDVDQRQIVSRALPVDRNVCRNHRRDYFIPYMLHIPEQLVPGSYTLELTIEDKKGDKLGNITIDFRVP